MLQLVIIFFFRTWIDVHETIFQIGFAFRNIYSIFNKLAKIRHVIKFFSLSVQVKRDVFLVNCTETYIDTSHIALTLFD